MSHYPEAHISTLSHSIMRMSRDELKAILYERDKALMMTMRSSCLEDRYQYGLPQPRIEK